MMQRFQITRTADMATLAVFREFITKATQRHPVVKENNLYDLHLAVDEVCTSIITLGYAGVNPGSIIITLELFDEKLILYLTDFGRPLEMIAQPPPEVEGEPAGLPFIYRTMDDVEYRSAEDGNIMKMTKLL
jgi:anti-sigma regulatory factor (Ser/Thr protein kinase)